MVLNLIDKIILACFLGYGAFLTNEEFDQLFKGIDELLLDATEQAIQRPKDKHKAHY